MLPIKNIISQLLLWNVLFCSSFYYFVGFFFSCSSCKKVGSRYHRDSVLFAGVVFSYPIKITAINSGHHVDFFGWGGGRKSKNFCPKLSEIFMFCKVGEFRCILCKKRGIERSVLLNRK